MDNNLQVAIDALLEIQKAHKFNTATLMPYEVHAICFNALEKIQGSGVVIAASLGSGGQPVDEPPGRPLRNSYCAVCGGLQSVSPSGLFCHNGHGGADSIDAAAGGREGVRLLLSSIASQGSDSLLLGFSESCGFLLSDDKEHPGEYYWENRYSGRSSPCFFPSIKECFLDAIEQIEFSLFERGAQEVGGAEQSAIFQRAVEIRNSWPEWKQNYELVKPGV